MMSRLVPIICPYCGLSTLYSRRWKDIKTCSQCGGKFFFYRKAYYLRIDDLQLLSKKVKLKLKELL